MASAPALPEISARHVFISGRVQGVGFRYHLCAEALRLGLTGWVRNRRDGRVEMLVMGQAQALASLLVWSRHGPPLAAVTQLHVELAAAADLTDLATLDGFLQYPDA